MEKENNVRTERIYIRVSEKEKEDIRQTAYARGFRDMSSYLMFLYKNDSNNFFEGRR